MSMGWMILLIVRVGEWLLFEGVVIAVELWWSYQARVIFACFLSRCYWMIHWLEGNIWVSRLKWERGCDLDLGMNRLKGSLGKCRWTGFRIGKFVGCFDIRVIDMGDSVIYCWVGFSVWFHTGWNVMIRWLSWGGKQNGMMERLFWRLAGWEIDRWRDPIWRLIVAQKDGGSENES